jgi:hypothetical protein
MVMGGYFNDDDEYNHFKSHDEFFKDFSKSHKKVVKFGIAVWIFMAFFTVGFWGSVIYVALHFIGKMW